MMESLDDLEANSVDPVASERESAGFPTRSTDSMGLLGN
jgi:hypothetical protein